MAHAILFCQRVVCSVKMGADRKNGFLKHLIINETKETVIELKKCFDRNDKLRVDQNKKIYKSINQYLETSQQATAGVDAIQQHRMKWKHIVKLIEIILVNKSDFKNRLNKNRNILDLWQKSRAFKDDESSNKFREKGNEYLREGQLYDALKLYNEALLFGRLIHFNIDI